MATKSKTATLAVPGMTTLPQGMSFFTYERGIDAHERLKIGSEVELTLDDGTTTTAKVVDMRVGSLIELLTGTGAQAGMMVSRIYSPLALVQSLTDQAGDVLDVTKVYTAVAVQIEPQRVVPQPA